MSQRLELLCGKRKEGAMRLAAESRRCQSDTPGGSDMIDISVPGGGLARSKPVRLDEVFPSAPHKNVWLERQDSD